jgi:molecular chaperone DnaJ
VVAQDWLQKDYYSVLGVPKDASETDIKKRYRKLARELHPDTNKGDAKAEERFKEVSEAYDVIGDPKQRKEYDSARDMFAGGGFRAPGGGGAEGFDLGDMFGAQDSGLGDLLGGLFNRGRSRGPQKRRGADVESDVSLSFRDALHGVTVPLTLTGEGPCTSCFGTGAKAGTTPRMCPNCGGVGHTSRDAGGFSFSEPCPVCRGRGMVVDNPCTTCQGSGRGPSSRTVTARVPAGVRDGQRIRLKGKGLPGENGGPAGDLYLRVQVAKHPVFSRSGANVTLTVPVTFAEAALGANITLPTPDGKSVTLKVPSGTANGRTFRVRGKGAKRPDGTSGDLLVTVDVAVPANLSGDAKAAVQAYAEATSDHDPRAGLAAEAAKE